jgi:hypothetical protein
MKRPTMPFFRRIATSSLVLGTLALSMSILANEPEQTIPEPGFRPESECADIFAVPTASTKIAVLPTLVRRKAQTLAPPLRTKKGPSLRDPLLFGSGGRI